LALIGILILAGCDTGPAEQSRAESALEFPRAERPVSGAAESTFPSEDARDSLGEAQKIMDRADIDEGMTVADIGAGEGYYTVRLSERVGPDGRVLAQDIDREALERLGRRVERERLDNVSIKLGRGDDPQLPADSFDRIFLVHMYHEVEEPYAFLWRLWPALARDGQVIVVDKDRPTDQHGIHPLLLSCEFEAVGYRLIEFVEKPDIRGYFARFGRANTRPDPTAIVPCGTAK
jgi:ubiquinone/menaquinone biosynthesis C-methylase UbiE